jgi:hypothetical protein
VSGALRIAMWSGPRNISTAMMRAWENREDCVVSDEPLYAHYLRPLAPSTRVAMVIAAARRLQVAAERSDRCQKAGPLRYQKHMCHHLLPGMDRG